MNSSPGLDIRGQIPRRKMAICILLAFLAISSVVAQQAPRSFKADDPPHRNLDASLYMQTSAEYRALCYQAYNLAIERLKKVAGQSGKFAVITDLDETVIDNSGFMAMQLRSGLAYDQRLWDDWEQNHPDKLALVPGAKEFISEADNHHVALFFISNRNDKFRAQTKYALGSLLGRPIGDEFLKLKTGASDKTARFNEVTSAGYSVLFYLGDNLRDFDETLKFRPVVNDTDGELDAAVRDRKAAIDKDRLKIGVEWIILPNPAYGEWLQTALGRGRRDLDRLVPEANPSAANPVTPFPPPPSTKASHSARMWAYLLSAIGSAVLLGIVVMLAASNGGSRSVATEDATQSDSGDKSFGLVVLVGIADTLIYVTLFLMSHPILIVIWLGFKIAAYWMLGRRSELGRLNLDLFVIVNAISLIVAYLGASIALDWAPLI